MNIQVTINTYDKSGRRDNKSTLTKGYGNLIQFSINNDLAVPTVVNFGIEDLKKAIKIIEQSQEED